MISHVHEARIPRFVICLLAAALASFASQALAASINYGNFGPDYPPGVTKYGNVTESSGTDSVPLFGPPEIDGDNLDFDPMSFVATANNGGIDVTDGQLNFTLTALPLTGMTSINISEGGDYSLLGTGTLATQVVAGLSITLKILEVDGVALTTPLIYNDSADIFRDLVTHGPVVLAPWSTGLFVSLAAILNGAEIPFALGVSKAEVVIDNQLLAFSEPGTLAFIAKKEFTITTNVEIDPEFTIPEPTTYALMSCALAGFGVAARRRLLRRHR